MHPHDTHYTFMLNFVVFVIFYAKQLPDTSEEDDHNDNGDAYVDVDDERRKPTEILYVYILGI